MKSDISTNIHCTDCGASLPKEWISSKVKGDCPECGSAYKTIEVNITEDVCIRESLNGKVKDNNFSSKRNPRYEFFEGADRRKADDKWMEKSRVIDKYNNKYKEKVTDPETGTIIHECEESLSEHFGHGSAKFKDDKNA